MKTPKRYVTFLGCAGLAALFVVGMVRAVRPIPSPRDHAQAITQTTRWLPEGGNPGGFPLYYWSDKSDLTYFANGKDGTPHLFQRPMIAPSDTLDKEGPAVHLRGGYAGQLSPNGKWFVEWHQNKLRQHIPTFVAMDGTSQRTAEPTWGMEGSWTQDSDAMLCGVWRTSAAIDLYRPAPGPVQKITLTGLPHFYAPQRIDSSGRLLGFEDGNFILPLRTNGLTASIGNSTRIPSLNYPFIKMVRVDPAHPNAPPEQWKIAVPKNVDHGSCMLSPAGDRILWMVYGDTTPLLLQQLKRFIPGMSTQPTMGNRWLISGLHGEDMHEIAAYSNLTHRKKGLAPNLYSHPRWMPDGKHLSFIFHNTLYTLPID